MWRPTVVRRSRTCWHRTTTTQDRPWVSFLKRRRLCPSSSSSYDNGGDVSFHKRSFSSSWSQKGHDVLADSFLARTGRPKILLESISPSGFDISNLLKKIDMNDPTKSGSIHLTGSVLAFPHSAFLWKVERIEDVTMESLAAVVLYRPRLEYLFIGSSSPIRRTDLDSIKKGMKKQVPGMAVEWLPLSDAMATFNVLNGEDRSVAVALVIDRNEDNYEISEEE